MRGKKRNRKVGPVPSYRSYLGQPGNTVLACSKTKKKIRIIKFKCSQKVNNLNLKPPKIGQVKNTVRRANDDKTKLLTLD